MAARPWTQDALVSHAIFPAPEVEPDADASRATAATSAMATTASTTT
jgi:hypothetical protein